MRRHTVALLVGSLLMASAAPASAECAMSEGFISAPNGAELPPDPVLYAFAPDSQWIDRGVRSSVPVSVGEEQRFGEIVVRALRFQVADGYFRVRIGERVFDYTVDPAWARGEERPSVGEASVVVSHWTCSFTDAVSIPVVSTAEAFEVSWDGGRTIVPRGVGGYFGPLRPDGGPLMLGHVSCLGATVDASGPVREATPREHYGPFARPAASRYEVAALYPDGTRRTVLTATAAPPPRVAPRIARPAVAHDATLVMGEPMPRWPFGLALGLGLLGGFALIVRVSRRGISQA